MNFQQLRIIRETLRHNFNLTEAANALRTSQSGVSKHIRDLEDELGLQIFVRRGKRLLGLTAPGEQVARVVERILEEAQNLEQVSWEFEKGAAGTITIATTHTQARYVLPKVISQFRKTFPEVRLNLRQMSAKDIASAILESEADVGVATDTLDQHAGIVAFPYHTWEHALVVPHGHPLTLTKSVTLEKIASYPIITYDEGLTGRSRIDAAFEAAGAVPDFAMSALDSDVIKAYVEYGLGVGIIASMAYDAARDTQLALIRCDGVFRPSTSSIAVRHGKPLRKYVYSFIEMCAPALTEATIRKAQSKA